MSVDYALCRDQQLYVTRISGDVHVDEVQSAYRCIFSQAEGWSNLLGLTDISESRSAALTASMVSDMAERISRMVSDSGLAVRCAIVAPSDALYGLANIYHVRARFDEQYVISVARDLAEAAQQLGVAAPKLTRMLSAVAA